MKKYPTNSDMFLAGCGAGGHGGNKNNSLFFGFD
jgi:hypothetical protein